MDNKMKAKMTAVIIATLIATAVFFLIKPNLNRSTHEEPTQVLLESPIDETTAQEKEMISSVQDDKN